MITLLKFINSARNNPVDDNVPDQLDRQMALFIPRQTIEFYYFDIFQIWIFYKYRFFISVHFSNECRCSIDPGKPH